LLEGLARRGVAFSVLTTTMADMREEPLDPSDPIAAQQKAAMLADEDPLLISQSLTYVTDDGETLHSFQSAPFSTGTTFIAEQYCVYVTFYAHGISFTF